MHTIYDAMEQKGVFRSNPANVDAIGDDGIPMYKKANFPRMYYHPKGEQEVYEKSVMQITPWGPQPSPERKRLITRVAKDEAEGADLEAEGWWRHPAQADAVREGKPVPETPEEASARVQRGKDDRIAELEKLLAERDAELAARPRSAELGAEVEEPKPAAESSEEDGPSASDLSLSPRTSNSRPTVTKNK